MLRMSNFLQLFSDSSLSPREKTTEAPANESNEFCHANNLRGCSFSACAESVRARRKNKRTKRCFKTHANMHEIMRICPRPEKNLSEEEPREIESETALDQVLFIMIAFFDDARSDYPLKISVHDFSRLIKFEAEGNVGRKITV